MKKIKTKQMVKMNLSLEKDFYELLQAEADKDYIKVATWTKQLLKRNLIGKNNRKSKSMNENERKMD